MPRGRAGPTLEGGPLRGIAFAEMVSAGAGSAIAAGLKRLGKTANGLRPTFLELDLPGAPPVPPPAVARRSSARAYHPGRPRRWWSGASTSSSQQAEEEVAAGPAGD